MEFRYEALDLAVVENHAVGFVARERAECFMVVCDDEIGRDVDNIRFQPRAL